ncbi:hypothetical protein D3C76_312120 [compost metagenome]
MQVGKAGVATAKIVQTDTQTCAAQRMQVRHRRAFGVEDCGFGNFQLQLLGRDAMMLQFAQQPVSKIGLTQLQGGDIDGQPCLAALGIPARQGFTGQPQHLPTQFDNETTALGQADEAVRVQQAEIRVVPAHQRLVAQHLVGVQAHLWLVVQHELALGQGTAERLFKGKRLDIGQVQRGVEKAILRAPCLLGRVHGRIGTAYQAVDVLAITRADAHPYTGAGVDLLAIQGVGGRQFLHQFVDPGVDLLLAALTGQQYHEFVAAKARSLVAGLQQALDTPGHGLQQQVADLVPERVVDRLETVHVDEQDRHQPALAALPGQRLAGHLDELAAVVQAAEVVGGGGVAAAPVFVLQAHDQLLIDLLGMFQRVERLLAFAQQAQGP